MYLKLFFLLFVSIPFIYCKKDALSLHCFFSKYILTFFELNEKLFILNRMSNAKSDYDIDDLKYYGANLQSQGDIIMAMLDELREKKYNELPDDLMMVNLYLNNVTGNIYLYTVDKSKEGRELVTDALRLRLGFKTYYKMITNKLLNFTKGLHCKYGLWFDKVDPKFKRLKINIDKKSQVNYDASRMREFLENVKNNSKDVFNHTFMRNKYTDYHPKNLLLYNLMEPYSKFSKRSNRNDGLNLMRFVKVHSIANYESKDETKIINLYERVLLTFNVQHIKSYQQQVLAATMYPVFMCISKYINMFNQFYSTGYIIFCYSKDIIDIGSSLVTITQTLRDINLYPYEINQYLSQLICDLGIIVIYPRSKMWPSSFNYKNKVITILNKLSKPMLTNRILFNIKNYTLNDSVAHSCLVLIDEIKIEINSITNYLKKLKRKRHLFLVTQEIINHNDMFKNIPIDVFNVQINGTIYYSEHKSKPKNNISNRLSKFFNQTEDYNNKERNKNNTNIQNVLESNENINITAEESHNYNEIAENHEKINSQNNYLQNVHLDNNEIAKNDKNEEVNKNNTTIQNVLESNENINIKAEESHNYNEIAENHEKINSQNNYLQNVHLDNNEIAKNDKNEEVNKNNTTIQNVYESNENINITAEESHNYNEITEKHEKINSQNNCLSLSGESGKYTPIYSVDHAEKTNLNNTINNLPNSKYNYLLLANNSKSDLNIFKEKYDKIVVELNNIYQQLNNIKSSDNNSIVKPSSILNYTHKCIPNYLYDIYNENNIEDDESGQNYFKNQLQVDDNFSQKHQLGYYETSNNSADIDKDNITNINNSMENNSVLFSHQRSENNYINENGEKKAEQFYHTNLSFAENSPSNNLQINSHKQQNVDGNESSNNSSKKILDYIIENGDKNIVETNFITNQLNINENFNNYSSIENKISFDVVSKFENNYIDKNNRLLINNDHITLNNPNKSINGNHSEKDKLTLVDKNIVFIQKSDETQEAGIMSHNRVDQINSPNDKINIHSKYFNKNNFEIKGNYLKKGPADDYYGNATLMHCFFSKYTLRYLELNEKYINSICDRNTSDTVTEDTLNFYISNLLFQSENIMAMLDELRNKQKNHFVHDLMSVNLYLNNITGNLSTNFQKNVDLQNENNNIEIRRQILQENLNILKSYILKYLDTNCHVVLSNQIDIHFKDLNQIVTIPVHDKVDSHTEKILADIQLLQYYGHAIFKTIVNKNDYTDFHPKNMLFYYLMTGNAKPDEITENNSIEHVARFDDGLSAIREVILKSSHESILKHTVVDVFYCVSLNFNADYVKAFQQIVLSATIHPIFKAISQYIIGFKQIYFIAKVSDKYATIITDIGNSLLKSIRQFFNLNLFSEEINTYLKGVLNKLEFIVNYKTKKLIKVRVPNIVSELLSLCSKPMELNWLEFIIEDNFKNTMTEDKLDLLTNDLRTITNKIYMYVKSLSTRRNIFNIVKRSISHDDMFKMKPIDILQICSRDA